MKDPKINSVDSMESTCDHTANGKPAPSVTPGLPTEPPLDEARPFEADNDPHRLARVVLDEYSNAEYTPLLINLYDEYRIYSGTHFAPAPNFTDVTLVASIKAEINRCNIRDQASYDERVADALTDGTKPPAFPVAIRVTRNLCNDVEHALKSMTSVDRTDQPPYWRERGPDDPDPISILPARNGLLDLSIDPPPLFPHTPAYISTYSLDYDYSPAAPRPVKWLKLLNDQWRKDPETIDALHEMLGYLLTPDVAMHKIFLLIGPSRSSRGTIMRIVTKLLGDANVAATSPKSLSDDFGLESLLGKTVAVMGDARMGDINDKAICMDRLLRISGGDAVDVNRKNQKQLGQINMPLRFIIVSNEMPNFKDASGAIVNRYEILKATRTIPPKHRNPNLDKEIISSELSGILNLAIEGRKRLYARGRFVQPKSARDLIAIANAMAKPVERFIEDTYYVTYNSTSHVTIHSVYQAWVTWAKAHGYQPGTDATFGKEFAAAYPKVKIVRHRTEGKQPRVYEGLISKNPFSGETGEKHPLESDA